MKLASCKSALNPTVVYSTDRSKAVVPVLEITLRLSDMTENALYTHLHSTEVSKLISTNVCW